MMSDAVFHPTKSKIGHRKRGLDRIPKLRLKTSGLFNSRGGPLSSSFSMNSKAPYPELLSPDAASFSTSSSTDFSSASLQTPHSAPLSYNGWGMAGVKEVNEEADVEMN
jgi:hypothetical protein